MKELFMEIASFQTQAFHKARANDFYTGMQIAYENALISMCNHCPDLQNDPVCKQVLGNIEHGYPAFPSQG